LLSVTILVLTGSHLSIQLHIIGSVWIYNACHQVHKLLTDIETFKNVLLY